MKLKPMLFQGSMVRAILAGQKTQTRRVIKNPERLDGLMLAGEEAAWAPIKPGDVIWVRETHYAYGYWEKRFNEAEGRDEWHFVDQTLDKGFSYAYEDTPPEKIQKRRSSVVGWYKRPSLFMPYVACRIWLTVSDVRAERLQDISEADAIAEGIKGQKNQLTDAKPCFWLNYGKEGGHYLNPIGSYQSLWESINGPGSWEQNPYVWVYTVTRINKPLLP